MAEDFSEESIDFLAYIKQDLQDLKQKEAQITKMAEEATEFISKHNIFEEWREFNVILTRMQNLLTPFIARQMALEEKLLAIQQKLEQVVAQPVQQQNQNQSWWSKLAEKIGLKHTPLPAPSPTTIRTAGTELEDKIAYVRSQFDNHYWWYRFHMDEGDDALLMQDTLYLSGLFSQIKTYVESAYKLQEERYIELREALTRTWVGAEAMQRVEGTGTK